MTREQLGESPPPPHQSLLALGRGATCAEPAPDLLRRLDELGCMRGDQVAVVTAREQLSYRELVTRVGQLAALLREHGVSQGSKVGVCLPRGSDELVSLIASWAAGAAYVPLDLEHPRDRIRMVLEDAAPEVLLTYRPLADKLELPAGIRVLALDQARARLEASVPVALSGPADPKQLAYVLFTSGSTGRPKGVAISREAISNFLRSMAHTPGLTAKDRLLAITTTSFDIAGLELFLPLYVGAIVHIADRETVLDPHKLRAQLERDAITVMQATPTAWRLLLEAGFGAHGTRLRMLCGGEAMSPELARRLTATGGELWNMYGPTETTVWSTVARVLPDTRVISIGRPIDETQVYVLGDERQLLPQGEVGELYIGGLGVARGYLMRPDLTAERFVQNPHGPEGDIIYRTGDLARFLPDGQLECLGRIDHQVKIRGFRIELGEIESCLRSVPGVREAVVVAHKGTGEEPELYAYWVGEALPSRVLAERVRNSLPSYMQPAAFVHMEELPLNTNGKIDRKRLPLPTTRNRVKLEGTPPRNDDELRMALLFCEALGVDEVPVDVDFALLGGTSVRASELRRRIQDEFGVEIPLAAMFEDATVQRLVEQLGSGHQARPLVLELRRGSSDEPPLLCLMGITLYRELALALETDRSVYGIHLPFEHRARSLPRVEDVAAEYVRLILERFPSGPYHLAGLCFGGLVAAEAARVLHAAGHEVHTVALFDAPLPRALRYHLPSRVRDLMARARHDLRGVASEIRTGLRKKTHQLASRISPLIASHEAREPVFEDLDVVGPIADAIVARYDREVTPLPVPLTVFRATEREEAPWYRLDGDLGWCSLTHSAAIYAVEGTHLQILQEPNVRGIAAVLDALLSSRSSPLAQRPSLAAAE